ncbi:MAG: caspase family protein, partial [Pseudomonadota bacterium]|nr:caspase family protein [Pseudomonadota bacterium]
MMAIDRIASRPGPNLFAVAASILLALVLVVSGGAQAFAAKRVAMVIGNSAYTHAPQLANPSNDASDMAAELRALGFVVVEGTDLTNRGMRDKIREFASELRGAEVGMLFYAGHGLQVNGRNYLAPVDAKLEFESDLDFETIPLEFIQRQMEREVKTLLLFLDACRDNPLTRSFKSASRSGGVGKGLAELKSAPGTLIAFATDPNNVALDGKGRNSPFTTALLANIARKD